MFLLLLLNSFQNHKAIRWMDVWMDRCRYGWKDGCVDGQIGEWEDGWMDGWKDVVWMDGNNYNKV